MGTQKEPAGQGRLGYEWPETEEAFKTPEARAVAKTAALAVLFWPNSIGRACLSPMWQRIRMQAKRRTMKRMRCNKGQSF
jgi:hypothetical protein